MAKRYPTTDRGAMTDARPDHPLSITLATRKPVEENLAALRNPELSEPNRDHLTRFGSELYREEKVFERLVRML